MTKSQPASIAAWARSTWVDSGVWLPSMPQWKLPITSWQPSSRSCFTQVSISLWESASALRSRMPNSPTLTPSTSYVAVRSNPKFVMPAASSASIVSV